MSGICGIVNLDGAPVAPETLQKMAEAAAHRGPDGIRYWRNGAAGLANLALNITPESFREQQPLVDPRRDLALTADARVDNREELIRTLTSKGFLQVTDPTDADVILAAYRCWDEACPAHIVGNYTFVIWDAVRRRLFAAREPIGTRALYYRIEPRRVLFATEVKQILAAPGVPTRIFEPAVGVFLTGDEGAPDWTYYQGINQLPPGHAIVVDDIGHRTWRYWDIDPDFRIEYSDEDQYAEHLAEIIKKAVSCRLRSARPVGIFLSGGMDSGSAASTAGWLLRQNRPLNHPGFRTYSWAFEKLTQCDERHISDGIVSHYDFPVTYIPADTAWPLSEYPAHGPDRDEPYVSFFRALADRTLAEARQEGTGLMMRGTLGDLMFGSDIFDYLDAFLKFRWRGLWDELLMHGQLRGLQRRRLVQSYMWNPLKDYLWAPGKASRLRRALRWSQPYPKWILPRFAQRVQLDDVARLGIPQSSLSGFALRKRYEDLFATWSMRDQVTWERFTARFGLGDADPFDDRRIAEFVLAVPQRLLNRAGERKILLRRSMRGIMPEEVRQAAGKGQLSPLFQSGLREHARGTVIDLVKDSRAEAFGYVDGQALREDVAAYMRGEHGQVYFWFALALEMWLRQYWA